VLFGAVNPSGKLTETVPLRLEDTPAFLNFPGEEGHVRYGEGLFVGYRWYDARRMEVEYPFGHGLSYTTFSYGDASASVTGSGDIEVRVTVTNTGERPGREIVQVYTSLAGSHVQRPPRELKGFGVIELEPGASGGVAVTVRREDLAYWDVRADRWVVEGGEYTIEVGASSRDLRARVSAAIDGDEVRLPLTRESSLGEVLAHPVAGPMVQGALAGMSELLDGASSIMPEGVSMERMMASFPIGRVGMMSGGQVTPDMIDGLLAAANAQQQ
jgi:beta-glucosidase